MNENTLLKTGVQDEVNVIFDLNLKYNNNQNRLTLNTKILYEHFFIYQDKKKTGLFYISWSII